MNQITWIKPCYVHLKRNWSYWKLMSIVVAHYFPVRSQRRSHLLVTVVVVATAAYWIEVIIMFIVWMNFQTFGCSLLVIVITLLVVELKVACQILQIHFPLDFTVIMVFVGSSCMVLKYFYSFEHEIVVAKMCSGKLL